MHDTFTFALAWLVFVGLIGCGQSRTLQVEGNKNSNAVVETPQPTPPYVQVAVPPDCRVFDATLTPSSRRIKVSEAVQFQVSVVPCASGVIYELLRGSTLIPFFGAVSFSETYSRVGTFVETVAIRAIDAATGNIVKTKNLSVSIVVDPQPAPVVVVAAPTVSIAREGNVTNLNEPAKVTITAKGIYSTLTLNGVAVVSGRSTTLPPASGQPGIYRAEAVATGPGGTGRATLTFEVPRCTHVLRSATFNRLSTTTVLSGPVRTVTVDGIAQALPAAGSNSVEVTRALPPDPGRHESVASVYNLAGDRSVCRVPYSQPHLAISTEAGNVQGMYFTNGYFSQGTSNFLMGGGAAEWVWGHWAIVAGASSAPVHTGAAIRRQNLCAANEVMTGIAGGPDPDPTPWARVDCAPLVPGLERYADREIWVVWGPHSNGSCASGEVLYGTGFTWPSGTGRLTLYCGKIGWAGEH